MALGKQHWRQILGVGFGIAFLWIAISGIDAAEIRIALSTVSFWLAVPLLGLLTLSYWFKTIRWQVLMTPVHRATVFALFRAVIIGFAANVVLPLQLGEFVRAFVISRQLDIKISPVLATIVVERLFDFITVLLILLTVLWAGESTPPDLNTAAYFIGAIGAVILVVTLACVRWTDEIIDLIDRMAPFVSPDFKSRLLRQARDATSGLVAIKRPRLIFAATMYSFLQWGFMGFCIYMSLLASGVEAPPSAAFVVLAFTIAGMTLPSTPGYLGTMQLCFILGLKPYGVSQSDAFVASIVFHLTGYVFALLLGLYFLAKSGYSLRQVRAASQDYRQQTHS